MLPSLARPRDTTAPPKKKAKDTISGIIADWESCRKPTLLAAASSATFSNADEDSMVKIGGILSDNEIDHVEYKALAKEPTKIQKGRNLKAKIVIFFL